MDDLAVFCESDWAGLSGTDRDTLRLWLRAVMDFQPLAQTLGVDPTSRRRLIAQGLAVEDLHSRQGNSLTLTDKGWLAIEWVHHSELEIACCGPEQDRTDPGPFIASPDSLSALIAQAESRPERHLQGW